VYRVCRNNQASAGAHIWQVQDQKVCCEDPPARLSHMLSERDKEKKGKKRQRERKGKFKKLAGNCNIFVFCERFENELTNELNQAHR